jgi:hypothetical protein
VIHCLPMQVLIYKDSAPNLGNIKCAFPAILSTNVLVLPILFQYATQIFTYLLYDITCMLFTKLLSLSETEKQFSFAHFKLAIYASSNSGSVLFSTL